MAKRYVPVGSKDAAYEAGKLGMLWINWGTGFDPEWQLCRSNRPARLYENTSFKPDDFAVLVDDEDG